MGTMGIMGAMAKPKANVERRQVRESLNLSLAWVSRAARVTDATVKHYEESDEVSVSEGLRLDHIYDALDNLREAINSTHP